MNLRRPTIYGAGTSGGSGRPITGGAIASGRLSHFEPVSVPRLKRPLASSIWNRNGYSNVWWTRRNSSSSNSNNHNSKSKTGNRVSAAKVSAPIPTQQQQRSKSITPKSADQRKIHFFDETILQNDDFNQDNNRPKSSPPLPNNNNNNNSEQKQKLKQRQQQTLNIARKPSAIYHYNSFQFLNSLRNFRSPSPSGGEPPVRASSTTTTSIVYHQHHHQQQHLRHHQTELARHYKMSKDILNNFVRLKATQIDDLFGGGGRRSQPDQSYFERQDSDNDNRGKYDESQIMGDGGDEEPEMMGERNEEETDLPIVENQLAESPQPPNGNINDNISAGSGGGISPKSPKSTSMIFEPHSSQQSQQQKIEMMKEEIEPRNEHKKAINRPKSSTTTTNPVLRHKQQHQQQHSSSGGGGSIGRSGKSSTGNIRPKSASNLLSNRRNALITNQRSQDSATQQHQVDNEHPPALSSPSTLEAGFLHRSLDRISSIANWERQIRYELEIEKELQRRELDRQKAKLQSDQRKLDEWDKQLRIELDARERKIRLAEDELRARHEECAANSAALLRREHTIDEIVAERIKAEMRVEIDKLRKKFNELEVDKCNLSKKEERVKEVEARLHEQVKIVKEKIDSKRMTDIEMAKFKKELEIIKKENEVLKEKVDSMEDYQVTKFENRAMKSELQILRDALDAKTQELERERERWEREQRAYDQKVISLRGDLRKAEQELQLQKQKEQCDIDEHNSRYEAVSAQLKRLQAFVKDHLAKLNSDFSSTTQSLSLLGGVSKRASPRHHASSHHLNRRLNRSIGGSSSGGGGGAQLGLNRNYHHQRSISMDGHDYMSTHASQQRSRNRDHSDQQQQQQQQPHHSSGLKNWNISSSFHHHHHHHRQRSPRGCLLCDDDDDDDDDVYDVDIYDDDKHVCENDEKGVCDHIERVNGDELHVPIIVEDEYSLAEIDERDSILEHDGGGGGGEEGKSIENGNSADLMVLRNQNQNFRNEKIAKQNRELTAVTVANEDEHLAASREQKIANKIYEKITNQNQNRISLSSGDHEAKHHHQRNNSSSNNNNSQNNNNNSNNGNSPIIEGNLLMSRLLSSMTMATQDTKMNSNNKIANNQINNFDQTTKSVSSLYAEERKSATNRTSSDDGGGSGSLIKSIRKLDLNNYEHEIEENLRHYNNGRTEANRKSKMTTHVDEDDEDDSPKSLYDELLQATGVGKIDSKSYLAAAAAPPPQQQQQRLTITTHNDDNNNHVVSAKTDTMTTSSVGIATTTATTTTTTTIIVDSSSPKISIVERDATPSLGAKSSIVPKQVNIVDADNRRKSASSSSSSSSRHNSQNGDSKSDSFEIDW